MIAVPVCSLHSASPTLLTDYLQIVAVKVLLWFMSIFIDFEKASWDDHLVGGLDFIANSVLRVPFFLMTLMRYISPTMDNM